MTIDANFLQVIIIREVNHQYEPYFSIIEGSKHFWIRLKKKFYPSWLKKLEKHMFFLQSTLCTKKHAFAGRGKGSTSGEPVKAPYQL